MHEGRKMSAFAPDLGFDPAQVVLALGGDRHQHWDSAGGQNSDSVSVSQGGGGGGGLVGGKLVGKEEIVASGGQWCEESSFQFAFFLPLHQAGRAIEHHPSVLVDFAQEQPVHNQGMRRQFFILDRTEEYTYKDGIDTFSGSLGHYSQANLI